MTLCDREFQRQFRRVAEEEGLLPVTRTVPAITTEIFRRQWREAAGLQGLITPARTVPPISDVTFRQAWLECAGIFGLVGATPANSTQSLLFQNGAGGSRQVCEGPTDAALFGSAPLPTFGVSFWYKVDQVMAQFHGPWGSATNSSFQNGAGVYRDTSDNEARVYIDAFNTSFFQWTAAGLWTAGGWRNLIITFDDAARQVSAWFNGTLSQSAINAIAVTRDLGGVHTFGASHVDGGTFADFNGKVDTAGFWANHLITPEEAEKLYNGGVPTVPSSVIPNPDYELVFGEDPADDPTPVTGQITDVSGNGNHFTPQAADNIPPMGFSSDVP